MANRVKALIRSETGAEVRCQFNPSEITITKSNRWAQDDAPGSNAPKLIFGRGHSGTMNLDLTLDSTHSGDPVNEETNELLELMEVDESLPEHDKTRSNGRPPWVRFHWGGLQSFRMVIEKMQVRFTYFSSDGTPLRANVSMSLRQFEDERNSPLQNPTSHTPSPQRIHQVQVGETLDRIASRYYGEPALWRLIARTNQVIDPLRLEPGTSLLIPEREVMARG